VAQQYNICGAACAAPQPANAVAVAAFVFNADSALAISLNDVCFSQYEELVAATGTNSAAFVVARANVPRCPGTNKSFGNAVIARFPITSSLAWTLSNPGRDCTNPSTECRGMVCVTGVSAGVPVGTCSAHFTNSDDTVAQQQAAEYALIGVFATPRTAGWPATSTSSPANSRPSTPGRRTSPATPATARPSRRPRPPA
jgi:hypothetical protein